MKNQIVRIGLLISLTFAASGLAQSRIPAADLLKLELARVGVKTFTDSRYKPGFVRHIVLFRYAEGVSVELKNEVKRRFLALQKSPRNGRPYILGIETGAQNGGENVDQGLEQAFIVTFKSQGDRNFYVGQPLFSDPNFYDVNHQTFKDFVGPLLQKNPLGVLVFDYAVEAQAP